MKIDAPRRKRIRLDSHHYALAGSIWHITITTAGRKPVLANESLAQQCVEVLKERCTKSNAKLLLYCVMPDHVHALIQVGGDDLIAIVRAFKSIVGIWWNKQNGRTMDLWQRSFHDRGIRNEQDLADAVAYVFANPVDAGLAEDWSEYPLIGGSLVEES